MRRRGPRLGLGVKVDEARLCAGEAEEARVPVQRKKISIRPIPEARKRQVTFMKRKKGLLKKVQLKKQRLKRLQPKKQRLKKHRPKKQRLKKHRLRKQRLRL